MGADARPRRGARAGLGVRALLALRGLRDRRRGGDEQGPRRSSPSTARAGPARSSTTAATACSCRPATSTRCRARCSSVIERRGAPPRARRRRARDGPPLRPERRSAPSWVALLGSAGPADTLTRREHRSYRRLGRVIAHPSGAPRRRSRRDSVAPCWSRPPRAADGGAAALQPWEGGTLLAPARSTSSPSLGVERVHVLTRPAWAPTRSRRTAAACEVHARRGARRRPARDRRASPPTAAAALVVAYADIVTQREVLAGLLAEPRMAHRHPHDRRPRRAAVRLQDARAPRPHRLGAARPTTPCAARPATFLGVLKVAPADRPASPAVAERLARARRAGAARRLAGGARPQGRAAGAGMLALLADDASRGEEPRADARGAATPPRCRRRTPPSSSAAARSAPDDVAALLLVGLIRAGVHVGAVAPAHAVLGAARCRRRRARARRARRSSSTTRTASCSTRRSRARTASSPRSSSRPTRSTSRAGRRAAG